MGQLVIAKVINGTGSGDTRAISAAAHCGTLPEHGADHIPLEYQHGHLPSSLLVELPGVVQCGVQEPGYDPPVPLFVNNGDFEMVQVLVKSVPSSYVPIVLFFLNSVLVRGPALDPVLADGAGVLAVPLSQNVDQLLGGKKSMSPKCDRQTR